MDRNLVYPGSIPLDSDLLSLNRNTMVALGYLAQTVLGTSPVVDGLACVPTSPPSLGVIVQPGSITQLSVVDTLSFGSLAADTTDPLVKMGINLQSTSFTLAPPSTSGQSINYLIQATLQEADTAAIVLPYYNAANPSLPYSGPGNSGTAQNTQRIQRAQLQLKAGAPAATGSQSTPPIDSGWTGLYVISVAYGQSAITATSISTLPGAPLLPWKLPALRPGFASGVREFTYPGGNFIVPAGVSLVEVEVWGGGSGSYASTSATAAGGGAGGGYARMRVSGLSPGQNIPVTVGNGGAAGTTAGAVPGTGGTSSFGPYVSATGAGLNYLDSFAAPQNGAYPPGSGVGGDINLTGSMGQDANNGKGGIGGGAPMGGSVSSGTFGLPGTFPGGGASGPGNPGNVAYNGAAGAAGLVIVRW